MSKYYNLKQLPKEDINCYYSEGRRSGKSLAAIGRVQEYFKNLKSSVNFYTLYIGKDTLQKYGELIEEYIPYNVKVITIDEQDLPHGVIMCIKEGDK